MYLKLRQWLLIHGKKFLLTTFLVSLSIGLFGWFSDVRQVAHIGFLGIMSLALLPFILLMAVILVVLILFLPLIMILAISGEVAGTDLLPDIDIPSFDEKDTSDFFTKRVVTPYYRFFGRQKSPILWGVLSGILLGSCALWGLTYPLIIRKEVRTSEILVFYQDALSDHYQTFGSFPTPSEKGHLVMPGLELEGPILDGFGRPIQYQLEVPSSNENTSETLEKDVGVLDKLKNVGGDLLGKAKNELLGQSYRLVSLGYDGNPSEDDLCLSGKSPRLQKFQDWLGKNLKWGDLHFRYKVVLGMRCQDKPQGFLDRFFVD